MTDNDLDVGGHQDWLEADEWDASATRAVNVCLPGDDSSVARLAEWLTTLLDKPSEEVPAVEEFWETASQISLERERYRPGFVGAGYTARLPEVVLPPPPQAKQERAVPVARAAAKKVRDLFGLRLRKRGRLTNALETATARSTRRWKDLPGSGESPARAWLRGYGAGSLPKMSAGEDILGVIKADGEVDKCNAFPTVWIPFSVGGNGGEEGEVRALQVCPHLVAELAKRRMFRSVTSVLLGSLRGRAVMWADEEGVPAMDLVRVLPGSVALALLPMPDEVTALGALRGAAGVWSAGVLGQLEQGRLVSAPSLPLGNFLRGPLSWFFARRDSRVLAPGVDTLTLSA